MNKDNLIEFAKDQCEIFPEDSYMGEYLRETLKMLQVEPCEDAVSREDVIKATDRHTFNTDDGLCLDEDISIILEELQPVKPTQNWIPVSEKYEHHIDHTDCIWYGNDSGCPVTCSQYRDGWNDAMDYIFKNCDGYRPYRRNENG